MLEWSTGVLEWSAGMESLEWSEALEWACDHFWEMELQLKLQKLIEAS